MAKAPQQRIKYGKHAPIAIKELCRVANGRLCLSQFEPTAIGLAFELSAKAEAGVRKVPTNRVKALVKKFARPPEDPNWENFLGRFSAELGAALQEQANGTAAGAAGAAAAPPAAPAAAAASAAPAQADRDAAAAAGPAPDAAGPAAAPAAAAAAAAPAQRNGQTENMNGLRGKNAVPTTTLGVKRSALGEIGNKVVARSNSTATTKPGTLVNQRELIKPVQRSNSTRSLVPVKHSTCFVRPLPKPNVNSRVKRTVSNTSEASDLARVLPAPAPRSVPSVQETAAVAQTVEIEDVDKADESNSLLVANYVPPPPAPSVKRGALPQSNVSVSNDVSVIAGSQALTLIFAGLNFVIVGLEESTTYVERELIKKYGGSVVPKSFKGVPDYAVVPLAGATLKQTATDIVTIVWLESCIEEGTILPISYFHQPVVMDLNKRPLNGCVLGLSGYSGKERQFICELAGALGAVCQDVFAKKSKSNAKVSSHLICKSSEGSEKFKAAIKWFRPAVYHSWLLACASAGSLVSEQDHLVDPKQEIKPLDHSTSMNVTVTSNSSTLVSKVESATVSALRKLPCFKTPERTPACYDKAEVERMLAWAPSPNPYEVKTPPVPLGISENPTPGESKRMQKWLDGLDSKLPVPSPTPPKRVSTPLHELRKKVLQAYTVTTPEMNQFINNED